MTMTQEHPITPPPELIRKWNVDAVDAPIADKRYIATQAARWGADQELEACVEWLKANGNPRWAVALQEGRRPKPPSLKEQAFELVDRIEKAESVWAMSELDIIRRALESLPE